MASGNWCEVRTLEEENSRLQLLMHISRLHQYTTCMHNTGSGARQSSSRLHTVSAVREQTSSGAPKRVLFLEREGRPVLDRGGTQQTALEFLHELCTPHTPREQHGSRAPPGSELLGRLPVTANTPLLQDELPACAV